jgi:hypothetical protein
MTQSITYLPYMLGEKMFSICLLICLLIVFDRVRGDLSGCIKCASDTCVQSNRVSVWKDSICVFDSSTRAKDVFYTGHVFGLGSCPAISLNVGKKCFERISLSIAENLRDGMGDETSICEIMPHRTPCMYSARKFVVNSRGADCAAVKILADNAVEECVRNQADGRFWATLAYWMAVLLCIPLIGLITSAFCG